MHAKGFHQVRRVPDGWQAAARLFQASRRSGKVRVERFEVGLLEIDGLPAAIGIPIGFNCQAVGNACPLHLLVNPLPAGGFKHKQVFPIHNQEGVVVIETVIKTTISALTMFFQQTDNHIAGFLGGAAAFQAQPQQIHARQTGFGIFSPGENSFIANANTEFIHAHLSAPHPRGPRKQQRVGMPSLFDAEVGRLELFPGGMIRGGVIFSDLRLVWGAIAVFGEKCFSGGKQPNCVAHTHLQL